MIKRQKNNAKTIALLGVVVAFAAILSYIEILISFDIWIPGVKLGMANIAIIVVLYLYGPKEAIVVNIVRIIVVGLLFGNMFSILFSLAGAFISLIVMTFAKKTDLFTILGVSVAGGVAHNMGQMLVSALVVKSYSIIYYMPVLIVAGVITGVVIGIIGKTFLKSIVVFFKHDYKFDRKV